jgi:signal peptidase
MKRVLEYLSTIIIALAMLLGLAVLLGPRLGWQIDTVLSGSMSPAIDVGGAVVSQRVDPRAIEVGDIITFRSPLDGKLTTHRVVGIQTENSLCFQTKGDANEDPDPFVVPTENVMGQVRFHIPLIGYATHYAKTPLGFVLMLAVPGLIIIIMEMRDVWIELSEQEKRKKAQKANLMAVHGEGK